MKWVQTFLIKIPSRVLLVYLLLIINPSFFFSCGTSEEEVEKPWLTQSDMEKMVMKFVKKEIQPLTLSSGTYNFKFVLENSKSTAHFKPSEFGSIESHAFACGGETYTMTAQACLKIYTIKFDGRLSVTRTALSGAENQNSNDVDVEELLNTKVNGTLTNVDGVYLEFKEGGVSIHDYDNEVTGFSFNKGKEGEIDFRKEGT